MSSLPLPLAQIGLSALNHVLRQQAWARSRLQTHAGRTVRIQVDSFLGRVNADARIATDGTLEATATEPPAVTLSFRPSVDALFEALRGGPQSLVGHLKLEGDARLASALGDIAQHMRWDAEEDLSRVVGDVLAHRTGQALRHSAARSGELRDRMRSGLRHALVDETWQLVDRVQVQTLTQELSELNARLQRLETAAARSR